MSSYLVGIGYLSEWLAEHAPEVSAPGLLSRSVLEDYMLWVRHESPWKPATRNQRLLAVRLLLEEQREDGLAGLPAGAVIHGAELPRVGYQLPKTLPGEVFAQWIDPANLARAGRARPHDRAGAGVHRLSGLERGHADARLHRASGPTGTRICGTSTSKAAARRCCRSRRCSPSSSDASRRSWTSASPTPSGCFPRGCTAAPSAASFTSTPAPSGW